MPGAVLVLGSMNSARKSLHALRPTIIKRWESFMSRGSYAVEARHLKH